MADNHTRNKQQFERPIRNSPHEVIYYPSLQNSLPSRIAYRYFPRIREHHRGRSIFQAGRYSEPWPRFNPSRGIPVATNREEIGGKYARTEKGSDLESPQGRKPPASSLDDAAPQTVERNLIETAIVSY